MQQWFEPFHIVFTPAILDDEQVVKGQTGIVKGRRNAKLRKKALHVARAIVAHGPQEARFLWYRPCGQRQPKASGPIDGANGTQQAMIGVVTLGAIAQDAIDEARRENQGAESGDFGHERQRRLLRQCKGHDNENVLHVRFRRGETP